MRNQLLIIFLLATGNLALAQHQIGIKLGGGISKIRNNMYLTDIGTPRVLYNISGRAGLQYTYGFSNNTTISSGLLINQINGKEKYRINSNFSMNKLEYEIRRNITYLSIPLQYGYTYKSIFLKTGIQTSFAMTSGGRATQESKTQDNEIVYSEYDFDNLNIDLFDLGFSSSIGYKFNNNIAVDFSYYHGINNILANNTFVLRNRQLVLGIEYTFFTSRNN